ncbi:MAG TPA: DNA-binding domain-containing protein [Kiloniellales bacterium]|nr:DNA-binding domain-containing protein [Kiloniellales bacterium]
MLRELQRGFAQALLDTGAPLPLGLVSDRLSAADRIGVYRNNVVASLVDVLAAAFPMTMHAAGAENFRFAASLFVRAHPPRQARLLAYGAEFPAWLGRFRPAQDRPWLGELARLEWARNEALFAADAEPVKVEALAGLAAEAIPTLRFTLLPSARLIDSDWPVHALWQQAQDGGRIADPPERRAQQVLVLRPGLSVKQLPLEPGDAALLEALHAGETFATAAEAALAAEAQCDLQQLLLGHLVRGTFAAVHVTTPR